MFSVNFLSRLLIFLVFADEDKDKSSAQGCSSSLRRKACVCLRPSRVSLVIPLESRQKFTVQRGAASSQDASDHCQGNIIRSVHPNDAHRHVDQYASTLYLMKDYCPLTLLQEDIELYRSSFVFFCVKR